MLDQIPLSQAELEDFMSANAGTRQNNQNTKTAKNRAWSTSDAGRVFVQRFANAFAPRLNLTGGTRPATGLKLLRATGLTVDEIARATAIAVFNVLALTKNKPAKRNSIAIKVADLVHDNWRIRHFQDSDTRRTLLASLFKQFDRHGLPRQMRKRLIRNHFDAEMVSWEGWDERERMHVGMTLYMQFVACFPEFFDQSPDGVRVWATQALLDEAKKVLDFQRNAFFLYLPMIEPPRPWSQERNLFRGAYGPSIPAYPLIKGTTRKDVERLNNLDLTNVINAVNAIQETPWRVNEEILAALKWAYFEHGQEIGKLPAATGVSKRRDEASRRLSAEASMAVAEQFLTYDRIYLPHNLDSRGRIYPVPAFLNPQGVEYVKALLEFADPKAIETEEQACWLAIVGANSWGNDKAPLQDRADWVVDNEDMILNCASDYRANTEWMKAADPFLFLRFCFEWRDFTATGLGFESRMVCAVDATCSGLQHFAAMMRDEVGGRSVNLVPGLPRQDVYQDVADRVTAKLQAEDTEIARNLLAMGVDRKITKRQTMVVPYAGTRHSCRQYTYQAVAEREELPWDRTDQDLHKAHVNHLSNLVWEAIAETVIGAKEAMRWLGDVASEWAKQQNKAGTTAPLTWITSDGFEVVQARWRVRKTQVSLSLDDIQPVVYERLNKFDVAEMRSSMSPNYVHSLDATHLRMIVNWSLLNDINNFAMVHDSFGCHAANMPTYVEIIKETFIALYQDDVLGALAGRLIHFISVPYLPKKRILDLNTIVQCDYAFS